MKDVEFPVVSYTRVSFKPYATFSERIVLHLVGTVYASSFDRVSSSVAGGKKRRFGEPHQIVQKVWNTETP
jgi:hypothetical protein